MPADEAPVLKKLTKEETAHLIRELWGALQAPGWTRQNRKDLEKIGEAIYSGRSLKDLDDDLYDRIFPHLVIVATHLGNALLTSNSIEGTAPKTPDTPDEPGKHHLAAIARIDAPLAAKAE